MLSTKTCTRCGKSFGCGVTEGNSGCWCSRYPALFTPNPLLDCLCPSCLHQAAKNKIDEYAAQMTPEKALHDNKAKELAPSKDYIEEIDYYIENGYWVFKAWHHLKRGYCCESGCRHCPYGFIKTKADN